MIKNKTSIVIFLITFLTLDVALVRADLRYNYSCTFYPEINLLNETHEIISLGEYFPRLVENTEALSSFKFQTLGGWTDLDRNIRASYELLCGERELLKGGGSPSARKYVLSNGTIITEFSWDWKFDVPEEKFCILQGQVFGINETWERENPCTDCSIACYIRGLSRRLYESEKVRIISKEEFFNIKQLEQQRQEIKSMEEQRNIAVGVLILTAIGNIVAWYLAVKNINANTKARKLSIFHDLKTKLHELENNEGQLLKHMEYIAFLVNSKEIDYELVKKTMGYWLINWYENKVLSNKERKKEIPRIYINLDKLYTKLKKNKI